MNRQSVAKWFSDCITTHAALRVDNLGTSAFTVQMWRRVIFTSFPLLRFAILAINSQVTAKWKELLRGGLNQGAENSMKQEL
jgi:hypothetical protein